MTEWYEQTTIPANPRYCGIFERLHQRILAYEQESQVRINRNLYMRSHFAFFGLAMYPNKLLTHFSWALYKTYERLESAHEEYVADEEVLQAKLLRFLSITRGEPERRVLTQLKNSGLFTPAFVHSRGLVCQLSTTRSTDDGNGSFSRSSS